MDKITIIIVSYNTKELLENCINSIRNHSKSIKIIIIDGSEINNECSRYVRKINNNQNRVIKLNNNIGHGKGMDFGINLVGTPYFCVVDSDTIMIQNPLFKMLELIKDNYGVGCVVDVDDKGVNFENGIKYLHPYFALINKEMYKRFKPFYHHGAPCLNAMKDINNKGLQSKLIHFDLEKYIKHLGRGTRILDPKEFKPKYWDK